MIIYEADQVKLCAPDARGRSFIPANVPPHQGMQHSFCRVAFNQLILYFTSRKIPNLNFVISSYLFFSQFYILRFISIVSILFFLSLYSKAQTITTYAGNGYNGEVGDDEPATQAGVVYPWGVCLDSRGNLYISGSNVVRKVDPSTGTITRFAGTYLPGYSGDGGPAVNAEMSTTAGICADNQDNIYIVEWTKHRIRKVNASTGIITTAVGNGTKGYSGDGGSAKNASLDLPRGVITDKHGNLYIADTYNSRIRKVDVSTGIITTIAGTGSDASTGDGGQAINAGIPYPVAVCFDTKGDFYLVEVYSSYT